MQQSDRAGLLYALAGFCTLSIGDAIIKGMNLSAKQQDAARGQQLDEEHDDPHRRLDVG